MAETLAKLSPPQRGNIYPRARLAEKLGKALEYPLVWISAPAGAGKTTLVASCLEEQKIKSLWYQVDEGDEDLASFFYYMGRLGNQSAPSQKKPFPLLTPEYLAGLSAFTYSFFRELFSRMKTPGVLVLDNFQDAGEKAALRELLARGLAEIPRGITVIIVSRYDPPASFSRLRASGSMTVLTWEDLRLTLKESIGIGLLHSQNKVKKEVLTEFHKQTQGWAAGLILLLEQPQLEDSQVLVTQDGSQALFDYFATEILQRADEDTQQLLLKTAVLSEIKVKTAKELTGLSNVSAILEKLVQRNYFTVKHGHSAPIYKFHPLFRAFLCAELKKCSLVDELCTLQRRAAKILETDGHPNAAIALLHKAGDWESSIPILLKQAQQLITQGRGQTVVQWIEAYPEWVRDQTPWLLYWSGICRLPLSPPEARQLLEKAYTQFKEQQDIAGQFLSWCGVVDTIVFEWGNFKLLDFWILEYEKALAGFIDDLPDVLADRVRCAMFIALMHRRPDYKIIKPWEKEAWEIAFKNQNYELRLSISSHLLIYYTWWRGDLDRASTISNALRSLADNVSVQPLYKITWHAMSAALYWLRADNDECVSIVKKGLDIAASSGVHVWDILLCSQALFALLSTEKFDEAAEYLHRMESMMPSAGPHDQAKYYYLSACNELFQGHPSEARNLADMAVKLSEESGSLFISAVFRNDLARMIFYQGQHKQAFSIINDIRDFALKIRGEALEYLTYVVEAEFCMVLNNQQQCLDALGNFLAIARKHGIMNHSWWQSTVMSRLYVMALEHGIEIDFVTTVIHKRHLLPPEEIAVPDAWPYSVKIYTLGRFSLLVNNQLVTFTGRAQKKPLALLKAMIAFGGRNISETQLEVALWPDAEGDAARRSLITNTQRLRKLLASNEAIEYSNGKLTLCPRCCWVDVWTFERMASQENEGAGAGEKAMRLYQGDFLKGEADQVWVMPRRERLRRLYHMLVERIGQTFERQQTWKEAVDIYRHGLNTDELAESFYQGLMRCHQELGQSAEAILAYEQCRQALAAGLGIQPSGATSTLYRTIIGDNGR